MPGIWINVDTECVLYRHYRFFSFIGNVRNGHGALGSKTGQVINSPLADKGLPDDMRALIDESGYHRSYRFINPYNGDYSWFLANEYLDALSKQENVIGFSLIAKKDYCKWLEEPVLQSGLRATPDCPRYFDRFPKSIIVVNDNLVEIQNTPDYEYVRVEYEIDLKEEFEYFTNEIKRLMRVHETDQIRFVYGFD